MEIIFVVVLSVSKIQSEPKFIVTAQLFGIGGYDINKENPNIGNPPNSENNEIPSGMFSVKDVYDGVGTWGKKQSNEL